MIQPTAASILTALWQQAADGLQPARPRPADPERIRALAQELGEQAMLCIGDAIGGEREALVRSSAGVLEILVLLWAERGLAPEEIWVELHKREQLGSLLMQLNQAQSRAPRRLLKPWKVDSTKLP